MKRRELLKLVLAGSASGWLAACAESARTSQTTPAQTESLYWDVIIVGAGIAGLRAGQVLQQSGLRILVLEARNRIGGRVWTDESTGLPLDLGASWIHGVRGNPITDIANRSQAALIETDYSDILRFDATGTPLTNELNQRVDDLLERYFDSAREYANAQHSDMSLQVALDAVLRQAPLSAQDARLLNYALNTVFEHEYAADISRLSAQHFDNQGRFSGGDALFKRGYSVVTDFLARNLDIRLNHIVQRIAHDSGGVTLTVTAPRAAPRAWRARMALITAPLGVLKRGSIVFEPSLPLARQQSIERLGMGLLNKCYLVFPAAFWDDATLLGYVSERKGEWAEWLNLRVLLGVPALLGFNAASYASALEKESDDQIIESAMQTLRRLYGADIPQPVDYRITRWASDPFAFGSYSYLAAGASPEDYDSLAQPVGEQLFFAGEHTQRDHPATVHGAYLSGERAANEILAALAGSRPAENRRR